MADKTPGELAAELARLSQENATLKALQAKTEADRGPRPGTKIRYRRPHEPGSRPGVILSDGFIERVPKPGGFHHFAHIAYGDAEDMVDRKEHLFECSAPYDPLGAPGTWCYPDDEKARLEAQRPAQAP